MTNAKIVALAKILTNCANSDMRQARKSRERNVARASWDRGSMCICGTRKGNVDVQVTLADRWDITCSNGDFLRGGSAAEARAFLIDCYLIVSEQEAA